MFSNVKHLFALTLLSLATVGCAAETGPAGEVPAIRNLAATVTEVTVGAQTQITYTFDAEDMDADLETWSAKVCRGEQLIAAVDGSPIAGAQGLPALRVTAILALQLPEAGDYTVKITATDANGNESNVLTAALRAR